jgi:hypothetical protein
MSYVRNLVTVLSCGIVCDEFRQVINNAVLSCFALRSLHAAERSTTPGSKSLEPCLSQQFLGAPFA